MHPIGECITITLLLLTSGLPVWTESCLDNVYSEKMWGDLRGGKKSIGELKGVPLEITVTLSNPGLALKRQQSWEQVKESAAKNVSSTSARVWSTV